MAVGKPSPQPLSARPAGRPTQLDSLDGRRHPSESGPTKSLDSIAHTTPESVGTLYFTHCLKNLKAGCKEKFSPNNHLVDYQDYAPRSA